MILKKNKKRNFKSVSLIIIIFFLISIYFFGFDRSKLKVQLHATNEWINSLDLGYSSLNNISNDGSITFQGDYNQSLKSKLYSLLINLPKILSYKIRNIDNSKFETLYLDINFKNFDKILEDRRKALLNGSAINLNFNEVPGSLIYNGERIRIKVRLKGMLDTHWTTIRRMSLKVELLDDKKIFGYDEFSIQKPRERQWPYNYVFERTSEKLNILSSSSKIAKVVVNGEKWGTMLVEESLGKNYLENKKKKESLIFEFADEREWLEGWSSDPFFLYRLGDPTLVYDVYNLNKEICNDTNRKIISYVINKFRSYDQNLFDNEKLNKALIFSMLWGNLHNLLNNNTSYYFNPYTLKLEPIIRDQYAFAEIKNINELQQWPPPVQFLTAYQNISNKDVYIKNIKQSVNFINDEFEYAKKIFPLDRKKNTNSIINNFLNFENQLELIKSNAEKYLKKLNNGIILDHAKLKTFNDFNSNRISNNQINRISEIVNFVHYTNGDIEIFNLLPDEVKIKQIIFENKNIIDDEIKVPSYLSNYSSLVINTNLKGLYDRKIKIISEYKNKTSEIVNSISLYKNILNPLEIKNELPNFVFSKDNVYKIEKGVWNLDKDLIIQGDLEIMPGTILKINENVSIIINGSIRALGKPNDKIIFTSINENTKWNGLYVNNSKKLSEISFAEFSNTKGMQKGIMNLTGAIVFYNSDIYLDNVLFSNNSAEDSLNIIESNYKLTNVIFENSISDAFDSDYSNGYIENINLINVGGDGLDFSGGVVELNKIEAKNILDKAISAGEGTNLKINNVFFHNVGVGIASKDGSNVFAKNCITKNPLISSYMTYIKKNNYSYPSLYLENCKTILKNKDKYSEKELKNIYFVRQLNTRLLNDGEEIEEQIINVDELYSSTVMKKNKIQGKCNAV